MVPGSAILSCNEEIGSRLTRSEGTFGDPIGAIHGIGTELSDAVPVEACSVVCEAIFDSDLDIIAPSSTDGWSRELTIDTIDNPRVAVRCQSEILNLEVVTNSSTRTWPSSLDVGINAVAASPALSSSGTIQAIWVSDIGKPLTRPIGPWVLGSVAVIRDLVHFSILRKCSCKNELKE